MFGQNSDKSLFLKKEEFLPSADSALLDTSYEERGDIIVFRNFLKPGFCGDLLGSICEQADWEKSVTFGEIKGVVGPEASPRQSSQVSLYKFPKIDEEMCKLFRVGLGKYKEIYEHVEINSDEGYNLLRYEVGGEYKTHVDRGAKNERVLSGLFYLNDDYDGGDLHFPRQNVTVKPETGMLVLFPSFHTHAHSSLPIKSGTKYAIVTWFK